MNSIIPLLVLTFCTYEAFSQPFITTWKTNNPGKSASNQITIPTTGAGYSYSIYWEQVGNAAINGTIPGPITGNHTITFPSASALVTKSRSLPAASSNTPFTLKGLSFSPTCGPEKSFSSANAEPRTKRTRISERIMNELR